MQMKKLNPFKPTAGMNPPELIGRDPILADFEEALENGPGAPDRLMRISGVRGVGKTVLLNALGDVARGHGYQVVDVASHAGFCDRILGALRRTAEISSVKVAPSLLGVSLGSVEFSKSATQLGEAMFEASRRGGLLITLDEIQDAPVDEMRELGNEIQLLIRQGANVAFAFAGLPSSVDGVVGTESLTFLQRAKHVELSRLSDFEVGESFEDTMRCAGMAVEPDVARRLTEASAGYPFMIQLVGYYVWQAATRRGSDSIEEPDAAKGIEAARASFDGMVIEPALRRLSGKQLEYLQAMARCNEGDVASGEVAEAMGTSTTAVGSYRKRLIDAGYITSSGYGKLAFAIPYMREYLLERQRWAPAKSRAFAVLSTWRSRLPECRHAFCFRYTSSRVRPVSSTHSVQPFWLLPRTKTAAVDGEVNETSSVRTVSSEALPKSLIRMSVAAR